MLQLPFGPPTYRLNLLSALCGAAGIGLLTAIVVQFTRNLLAAAFAACALALSHAYWQMSALTETYTLACALMLTEWLLLVRFARTRHPGWLVVVFAANGLHVADHLLGLLPLATYGILLLVQLVRRRIAPRWVPLMAVVWLLGAAPYLLLVAQTARATGDLSGTFRSALFGGGPAVAGGYASAVLNTHLSAQQLKLAALTFGYCFPSLAGLVALLGLLRPMPRRRRLLRYVLLAQTVLICVFVGRYPIADLYTYFVPVCAVVALWCGCGAAYLHRPQAAPSRRRYAVAALVASSIAPVFVYIGFPLLAEQRGLMRAQLRHIPFRNEYTHFFRPWRSLDDSPRQLSEAALAAAEPNGWILADATTVYPIALTALSRRTPPQVRIYWTMRDCLFPAHVPDFTQDALTQFVISGGHLVAVPSPEIPPFARPPLCLRETTPLWRIEPCSTSPTATSATSTPAP